jgi:hypothetical protein
MLEASDCCKARFSAVILLALPLAIAGAQIAAAQNAAREGAGARPAAPRQRGLGLVVQPRGGAILLADAEDLIDGGVFEADDIELLGGDVDDSRGAFDRIVFGGEGETPVIAARRRLERLLKERVAVIEADIDISAGQARKLELAGRGDIERLLGRIADCRRRFEPAPEDERLQVEAARLQGLVVSGPFDDRSLLLKTLHTVLSQDQITRLDVLRAIRQAGGQIEKARGSKDVHEIQMTASRATDAGLHRVNLLREVKVLGLASTRITDAGLAHLAGMDGLTVLDLTITKVTDRGLARLATLRGLVELNLSGTEISDAGLAHLKGLGRLERLNLGVTQITDAGLEQLSGLDLKQLNLNHTRITDAGLAHLQTLKHLERLSLHNTDVSDAAARSLAALVNLRQLVLDDTLIGDEGLAAFAGLRHLERLDLSGTRVTGTGLAHLKTLSALRSLDLTRTRVKPSAVAELKKTLPELAVFH